MNRREFLFRIGGTVVAVPLVLEALGCGDDNTAPGTNATNWTATSTGDATGHAHTITLQCSQLTSAGNVTYTASTVGHAHQVTLIPAQLAILASGGSVTQASDPDATGHGHSWTIQKPAATC